MDLFKAHVTKYACDCDCAQEDITSAHSAKLSAWDLSKFIPMLRTALTQGIKASPKVMPNAPSSNTATDKYIDVLHQGIPGSAPVETPNLDVRGPSKNTLPSADDMRYA